MNLEHIPANWTIQSATPFFTRKNVPKPLLSHHNTAAGVFGQICVMAGSVRYFGFANEHSESPECEVVINAGQFITTPPQYWHRVALSEDAQFHINFWSDPKHRAKKLLATGVSKHQDPTVESTPDDC